MADEDYGGGGDEWVEIAGVLCVTHGNKLQLLLLPIPVQLRCR